MPRVGPLRRSLIHGFKNADLRAFIMVWTWDRQHAHAHELGYRRVDALSDFVRIVYKYFLRRQALPHLFICLVRVVVVHFARRRLTIHLLLQSTPFVRIKVVCHNKRFFLRFYLTIIFLSLDGRHLLFFVSTLLFEQAIHLDDVDIVLHALVLWQHRRRILECFDCKHFLLLAVIMTA